MPSLLNGLSALGTGVAQFAGNAGLELQKAQLAQQQTILADQLATTRETALQQSAGQIAQQAATQQQGATAALESQREAAAASEGAAGRAAEMARTQATINAPPDVIKVLRDLGALPQAGSSTPPAATNGTGASTGASGTGPNASAAPSSPAGASSASSASSPSAGTSAPSSPAAPSASANPLDNPLVRKALGYPQEGSDEAIRFDIAQDVKKDPNFKYKSAGVQAAEIESRVTAASGKMMDPTTRDAMATAIASYQQPPITGRGLTAPGAGDVMAKVAALNPDYQASRYDQVNKAMVAFGTGPQGDQIRRLDTGVQHLSVLGQAVNALDNGMIPKWNSIINGLHRTFGVSAPNTFDGLKQLVAAEIEKSVSGGLGTEADRKSLMDSLNSANSPKQLTGMLDGYRSLMTGQLSGLKQQYEQSTGFTTGPFAFGTKLAPETINALSGKPSPSPVPADPAARQVGKSYPLPNGKVGIWRGTGWEMPQ